MWKKIKLKVKKSLDKRNYKVSEKFIKMFGKWIWKNKRSSVKYIIQSKMDILYPYSKKYSYKKMKSFHSGVGKVEYIYVQILLNSKFSVFIPIKIKSY